MGDLVAILVVVIILGALAGGRSFGGTIRKGCGCLIWIVVIIAVITLLAI